MKVPSASSLWWVVHDKFSVCLDPIHILGRGKKANFLLSCLFLRILDFLAFCFCSFCFVFGWWYWISSFCPRNRGGNTKAEVTHGFYSPTPESSRNLVGFFSSFRYFLCLFLVLSPRNFCL